MEVAVCVCCEVEGSQEFGKQHIARVFKPALVIAPRRPFDFPMRKRFSTLFVCSSSGIGAAKRFVCSPANSQFTRRGGHV
jgi:hypothetical protein